MSYPPNVRVIRVPSTGRLNIGHILHAFAAGADGVVFIEGYDSLFDESQVRSNVIQLKKELRKFGIQSLRLMSSQTTLPQCDKAVNLFQLVGERISKMGRIPDEKRKRILGNLGVKILGNLEV